MICVIECSNCMHKRPLLNGWKHCCDAFPNGIPMDFDYSKVKQIKKCNNGIGFELIE